MKTFIETQIGKAIDYLKHGSKPQEPEEPEEEKPYQKTFMEASKTLFNIARKLREINEVISLYKTGGDLSMEDFRNVCSLYYDLKALKFEPFDILIEEALVEAGGKSLVGVMRLLGIEIKAFKSIYKNNKDWFNRQTSFEHLYERIARERFSKGPERVEKVFTKFIEAYKEYIFYQFLSEMHYCHDFEGLSNEESEKRYEFCLDKTLEITQHRLVSKDREYISEQRDKYSREMSYASSLLGKAIGGCYFYRQDFREEFEGITFDVFVKLNSLCNMFAEYVNRFKCNSSGELPDDGSLYFTDILKPLYEKCNGLVKMLA